MHRLYLVLRDETCSAATLLLPSDCELLDSYHPESARECVLRSALSVVVPIGVCHIVASCRASATCIILMT